MGRLIFISQLIHPIITSWNLLGLDEQTEMTQSRIPSIFCSWETEQCQLMWQEILGSLGRACSTWLIFLWGLYGSTSYQHRSSSQLHLRSESKGRLQLLPALYREASKWASYSVREAKELGQYPEAGADLRRAESLQFVVRPFFTAWQKRSITMF